MSSTVVLSESIQLISLEVRNLFRKSTLYHKNASISQKENSKLSEKSLDVSEGDIVRVVAPSRKTADSTLPLIKTYVEESLKLVPIISDDIYSNEDPFYSNTDEYRANDLISALLDPNVKIIWCVRGGTGSIRLIPYLEQRLPATLAHKIFIGYSDITVLHLYFQYKYGWQTMQVCETRGKDFMFTTCSYRVRC